MKRGWELCSSVNRPLICCWNFTATLTCPDLLLLLLLLLPKENFLLVDVVEVEEHPLPELAGV